MPLYINLRYSICNPKGANIRPTKGHPDHRTAIQPNNMQSSSFLRNQYPTERLTKLLHIEEGKSDEELKNIPGEVTKQMKKMNEY